MSAKSIVVTGASRGLGAFLARRYLDAGWTVFGCSRGEATIEAENYFHSRLDVGDEKAVIEMLRLARARVGKIDALINNAGAAAMNHIVTTPLQTARRIFDANFFGSFLFCREAGKMMIRQKHGSIVNVSTVAVPLRLAGEAVYAASKAAVETFTRVCAAEFAPYGVRVNAVGPAPVETALTRAVPPEKMRALFARLHAKNFGRPEDVAGAVDFFVDDSNAAVTGQILYLGGA